MTGGLLVGLHASRGAGDANVMYMASPPWPRAASTQDTHGRGQRRALKVPVIWSTHWLQCARTRNIYGIHHIASCARYLGIKLKSSANLYLRRWLAIAGCPRAARKLRRPTSANDDEVERECGSRLAHGLGPRGGTAGLGNSGTAACARVRVRAARSARWPPDRES